MAQDNVTTMVRQGYDKSYFVNPEILCHEPEKRSGDAYSVLVSGEGVQLKGDQVLGGSLSHQRQLTRDR